MHTKIRKILFASDLTENSRRIFYYAAVMGRFYKIGIILLHVIEKIPLGMRLRLAGLEGEESLRQLRDAHEQEARKILMGKKHDEHLLQSLVDFYSTADLEGAEAGFEITDVLIKEGNIAEEITSSAVEHECSLSVMGAHKGFLAQQHLEVAREPFCKGLTSLYSLYRLRRLPDTPTEESAELRR